MRFRSSAKAETLLDKASLTREVFLVLKGAAAAVDVSAGRGKSRSASSGTGDIVRRVGGDHQEPRSDHGHGEEGDRCRHHAGPSVPRPC